MIGLLVPLCPEKYYEIQKNKDFSVHNSRQYLETIPEPAAISVHRKKEQVGLDDELAQEIKQAYYATVSLWTLKSVGCWTNSKKQVWIKKQ